MNLLRTRLTVATAGILLALSTLAGCAGTPPDLQESTAADFQLSVLDVTIAAKAGDYATAQAALNELQANLLTATAAEQVSGTRSAQIQAAINQVNDDLAEAIAEAEARAIAEAQAAADAQAEADARAAAEAEAANDAPAPAEEPADDKGNDDNKGEGDDKGKDDDCKKGKDDC